MNTRDTAVKDLLDIWKQILIHIENKTCTFENDEFDYLNNCFENAWSWIKKHDYNLNDVYDD